MSVTISGKMWLLVVLLVLLAVSIFHNVSWRESIPIQSKINIPKSKKAELSSKDEVLETALLSRNIPEFSTIRRNIFEFDAATPPIVSEVQTEPTNENDDEVAEAQKLPDVRYLAFYLEKNSKSTPIGAIINGGRIYVGVEGDTLAGKYKVLHIGDEYIVLRYLPDNRIIRLPMGKESGVVVEENESATNR